MPKIFLVFFGPPGSGKGTQVDMLAEKLALKVISPGELMRHEEEMNTPLGKRIRPLIDSGKFVPDGIVEEIVKKSLKNAGAKNGAVFDGFPRKKHQLAFLSKVLEKTVKKEDKVQAVLINVSASEVKRRLGGRRACDCGAIYHLKFNPPKKKNVCDLCGKKLYVRADDKPALIGQRLKFYRQEIKPLLDFWKKSDKLIRINGERKIPEIQKEILKKLKEKKII